jgi:hypothetical protein
MMKVRNILMIATAATLASGAPLAQDWTGPGWYQVAGTSESPFFWAGPFKTLDDCDQTLPEPDPATGSEYRCEYVEFAPGEASSE